MLRVSLGFIFIHIFFLSAIASEKLGRVNIDNILLYPTYLVEEGQHSEFGLGLSSASFSWVHSQNLSAVFRIGKKSLINPALHFIDTPDDSLGIYEAFGYLSGLYGNLRMGLIPVNFGLEGSWSEEQLIFPRSLLFDQRVMALRDLGLSYQTSHNGYYTSIAIHNGESDKNLDGRMFITSSWGWMNHRNLNLGVSAQAGTTKPLSTSTVKNDFVANVDVNEEALWRIANIYTLWNPHRWYLMIEMYFGEVEQDQVTKYHGGHGDFGYQWNSYFGTFLRYDHFDPNEKLDGDLQRQASLALRVSDKYQVNTLFVTLIKKMEQGIEINNDQVLLSWRLTAKYSDSTNK